MSLLHFAITDIRVALCPLQGSIHSSSPTCSAPPLQNQALPLVLAAGALLRQNGTIGIYSMVKKLAN